MIGAICWILTVEYYIAQIITQSAWPDYSISKYDVSALGVTTCGTFNDPSTGESLYACSPLHAVMNAGFIILGVLVILGTFLLRSTWPKRRLTTAALVLIAIGGFGEILAGYAPGNENVVIHAIGALLHWLCGYVGIILLGFATWKTQRTVALFSFFFGLIAIVGFFLYGNHVYLGLGRGGMQRIVAYPSTIWMITIGILFLRSSSLRSKQYG